MPFAHRLSTAAVLVALSVPAIAATTTYTSAASFLANVTAGAYTENFNGLPSSPPTSFSGGAFTYAVAAGGGLYGSGDFLGTNLPNEALTVTFTSGNVTAVGGNFYATDISDSFQSVTVKLTLSDGTTATFTPTSATDSYRGFTSTTTISSLVMSAPGVSLYAGMDNLTVGLSAVPVPEPAAWLLMGLGLAGIAFARRRNV